MAIDRLRPRPPARPPRGAPPLRRILLFNNKAIAAHGGAGEKGGDRRRRLSPRQRPAGDLLLPRDVLTVSLHGDPVRVSLLHRLRRRTRRGPRGGLQPQHSCRRRSTAPGIGRPSAQRLMRSSIRAGVPRRLAGPRPGEGRPDRKVVAYGARLETNGRMIASARPANARRPGRGLSHADTRHQRAAFLSGIIGSGAWVRGAAR